MTNSLSSILQGGNYNPQANGNYNPQAPGMFNPQTNTQVLPNGGGSYNPAGNSAITPAPIFTGVPVTPLAPAAAESEIDLYAKYRDPKTGEVMTPQEYAVYLGNKAPKGTGDISNYAGDAMTNPNQTTDELTARARNLNNARNDIATGETDPYGVGNKSGIAYSPTELKAIESAYAGIYDPALNDVFSRLQEKEAADAKIADREAQVFATNENIRQWRATTGTKSSGGGSDDDSLFSQSQINDGASNAGLGIEAFTSLDNDIKNFYVNPPMALNELEKKVPIYENFNTYNQKVIDGEITSEEVVDLIMEATLPVAVKHYFIEQIPEEPEKKLNWFQRLWNK